MLKKISNKIIISFTVIISILIIFLLVFFNNLVKDTHLKVIKREMSEKIRFLELHLTSSKNYQINIPSSRLKKAVTDVSKIIGLRITLIDFNGKVTADSDIKDPSTMDNHRYRIEINNAIKSDIGYSIRYSNTLKTDMLYYAHKSEKIIFRLAKPLTEIEESLSKLRSMTLFISFLALFISVIISIINTKRITKPIRETLDFADDFSNGEYSKRILNYSDDEIGTLQRALNKLADIIVEKMNNLILEQKKLNVTIETIQDGISVIDDKKKIIIANRAFNSFLDIKIQSNEKMYYEVIRNRELNMKIDYCISHGKSAYFEETLLNEKTVDVFINPIKEEKTLKGILVVLHDITERKKLDRLKTDLVGNISHELKTPIAIMKGYLETISDSLDNTELVKEFINKAIINADRQNSIVNDMLKLNLLETAPDFPIEKINIKDIIEGCIDLLSLKAVDKEIVFKINLEAVNHEIESNKFLAEEVFFNIIDNAISYNREEGDINISAENSNGKTKISIANTGIGIPKDSIERIFERFYRVNKSRSRSTGGTGLGLSIVKHVAGFLNWDIHVTSDEKETVFIIDI